MRSTLPVGRTFLLCHAIPTLGLRSLAALEDQRQVNQFFGRRRDRDVIRLGQAVGTLGIAHGQGNSVDAGQCVSVNRVLCRRGAAIAKVQAQLAGPPVERSVKVMVKGTVPEIGLALNRAVSAVTS